MSKIEVEEFQLMWGHEDTERAIHYYELGWHIMFKNSYGEMVVRTEMNIIGDFGVVCSWNTVAKHIQLLTKNGEIILSKSLLGCNAGRKMDELSVYKLVNVVMSLLIDELMDRGER